eukprot:1478368-Pyramimonas_sp.AAC.1
MRSFRYYNRNNAFISCARIKPLRRRRRSSNLASSTISRGWGAWGGAPSSERGPTPPLKQHAIIPAPEGARAALTV